MTGILPIPWITPDNGRTHSAPADFCPKTHTAYVTSVKQYIIVSLAFQQEWCKFRHRQKNKADRQGVFCAFGNASAFLSINSKNLYTQMKAGLVYIWWVKMHLKWYVWGRLQAKTIYFNLYILQRAEFYYWPWNVFSGDRVTHRADSWDTQRNISYWSTGPFSKSTFITDRQLLCFLWTNSGAEVLLLQPEYNWVITTSLI